MTAQQKDAVNEIHIINIDHGRKFILDYYVGFHDPDHFRVGDQWGMCDVYKVEHKVVPKARPLMRCYTRNQRVEIVEVYVKPHKFD